MNKWTRVRRLQAVVLAAALTACSEPTAPSLSEANNQPSQLSLTSRGLVICPTNESQTTFALVGGLGGTISLGGTQITFPQGALPSLGLSLVRLSIPASQFVEIDVSVNGLVHFAFGAPVRVVIYYGRCSRSDIDRSPLTAWYINPVTKAFIADMSGVDDKAARTVTFETDHFSGYAIAQ
ncbi:MAG: hypothetical protein ACT4PJ_11205 [Gemmatimonadaceae bacterium]